MNAGDTTREHTGVTTDGGDGGGSTRRIMLAVTLALIAALLVIAAQMERTASGEPRERIGRRMELTELIVQERQRAEELQAQIETLSGEINEYERAIVDGSDELAELQAQVEAIAAHGGSMAVRGEGLTVTLEDSSLPYDGVVDANNFVIHQQDLRAVLNALWAGGAEAVSINDSRVLATSGVVCVGNTLHLNGQQFAPPFVIAAVGDPQVLAAALDRDPVVQRYRAHAADFDMRFDVDDADELLIPPHPGTVGLQFAEPVRGGG